jgi:hypothetical protein
MSLRKGCILLLLISMSVTSCRSSSGHPPIEKLLIDISTFPKGWSTSAAGPSPIPRAPLGGTTSVESIELDFYAPGGGAFERIRRFKAPRGASNEFTRQKRLIFRADEWYPPWQVPEELGFESLSADRFHYACSQEKVRSWSRCAYIAQYGTYFVHFDVDMLPGYMGYADLENILQAIDERMSISELR